MPSPPGRDELDCWLEGLGLRLSPPQWARLDQYLQAVSDHNEKVNLTSDSGKAFYLRHAADAFAALPALKRRLGCAAPGPSLLDLGAGAGFIGVALKIAWPEVEVTLLESSQRKFRFLNWAAARLEVPRLRVVLGSAPRALQGKTFDAVIVRAVAPLEESARLGLASARPDGGFCVLYRTQAPDPGEQALSRFLEEFKARVSEVIPYRLPGENAARNLVILERGL